MPATFANLLKCSLGTSEFQLADWAYKAEPILKDGQRTGTKHTVEGEGWVEASSESILATRIAAAVASFVISGQNFVVYGHGGVTMLELLAAQCSDGGPHITVEVLKQKPGAALKKDFKFTVVTDQGGDSTDPNKVTNTYKVQTVTRPDGLKVMTASGELVGKRVGPHFDSIIIPFFDGLAPAPNVPVIRFDANAADDKATYSIEYSQLASALPVTPAGTTVVEGELVTGKDRDPQMRQTKSISFDFLVDGDPIVVRDTIRATLGVTPFHERFEVTAHKEVRVRGEFVAVEAANADDLIGWEQTVERLQGEDVPLKVATWPGIDPLIYRGEKPAVTLMQKGSALGLGRFPKPPAPLFPNDLAEKPRLVNVDINSVEKRTEWEYRFVFVSEPKVTLAQLARPLPPVFELP